MESIWSETDMPHFPPLRVGHKTDVLIIGGGMAGILCARMLHDAGIDCTVLEANRIGCGITKNTTAKITSQHGLIYHKLIKKYGAELAGLYLGANERAVERYSTMCQKISCDYLVQDNYIYSRSSLSLLETELEALKQIGSHAEFARNLPLPFPTVGAVRFPNQAQFHPLKFLAGILDGLTIYEKTTVRELMPHRAITDRGSIHAGNIIVATHFPILNKHGSYFLKMYQQRSYVLSVDNVPTIDGMYLDSAKNGLSFRSYGGSLLVGGSGHRTGRQGGSWQELEDFARKHYPQGQITHRWATQDCMTLDAIPYIGRYSKRTEGLYVATGFNKWGMTSSMVAAELLTDLIINGHSPYESVFSPSRSILHPQLALNTLESAVNLLTPTAPRCPHLGCALKWNPHEHSWDCPCHGSRFEADGTLIDNPATGDIKRMK